MPRAAQASLQGTMVQLTSSLVSSTTLIFSIKFYNIFVVLTCLTLFECVSLSPTDLDESVVNVEGKAHHVRHLRHQLHRFLELGDKARKNEATQRTPQYDEKLADSEVGGTQCPPSVRPVSNALCEVRKCFSHAECRPDSEGVPQTPEMERVLQRRACCYNGCVYSCMHRMPPPAVFDWLEETPDYVSNIGNSSIEETGHWQDAWLGRRPGDDDYVAAADEGDSVDDMDDTMAAHVAPPDVVALSGGCVLTHSEYLDYQKFQKSKYIEGCYCKQGEVFCKVEHSTATKSTSTLSEH